MSGYVSRYLGIVGTLTLGAIVGCTDDFEPGSCKESRSCTLDDASSGEATGGAGGSVDAVDPNGGDEGGVDKGLAGAPTDMTVGPECSRHEDCSNGDANDGQELCRHGTCGAGDAPPRVVAVTPNDEADDADPDGAIAIEFSEPVKAETVTAETVRVFDGDAEVAGTVTYANAKATFTPDVPLRFQAQYWVKVSEAVEDDAGQGMLSPFDATFKTRDGAWKTIDAVVGGVRAISPRLPISARGDVLLAWRGAGSAACPASAQRFRLGHEVAPASAFDRSDTECSSLVAAGNADGVGAVLWQAPARDNAILSRQLRSDAWQSSSATVTNESVMRGDNEAVGYGLGVSPSGMVTVLVHQPDGGTMAWRTDARGAWISQGDVLSAAADAGAHDPQVAFDPQGNGLAVWRARRREATQTVEVLQSRFNSASGKWLAATPIPRGTSIYFGLLGPSTVLDDLGNGLVVWPGKMDGNAGLLASTFSKVGGFASSPFSISAGESRGGLTGRAQVVFDGQTFTAAWTGRAPAASPAPAPCGTSKCVYSARLDQTSASWKITAHSTKADLRSAELAPSLATDGRGSLMLVWATVGSGGATPLVYQRYVGGGWQEPEALPGGEQGGATSLAMNGSGMAAASWAERDSNGNITTIRLASFY